MAFSDIPDRTNGTRILRGWFNDLRDAGILVAGGATTTNSFVIANNQSSAASVTSAVLSSANFTSWQIIAEIKRSTTVEIIRINAYYNGTVWAVEYNGLAGTDSGVTFSIDTSTGQLKYTSTNTSAGTMKWSFNYKMAA